MRRSVARRILNPLFEYGFSCVWFFCAAVVAVKAVIGAPVHDESTLKRIKLKYYLQIQQDRTIKYFLIKNKVTARIWILYLYFITMSSNKILI